jgi:ABC-type Na+ efflux pump permease subunit
MIEKIFRIARAEYLNSITSKAFVLGVLATPLLIGLTVLVQGVSDRAKGGDDRKVGIVDLSGRMMSPLTEGAQQRNAREIEKDGKKVRPAFLLEAIEAASGQSEDDLIWVLSERVRNKELFGFALIGADIFTADSPTIRYYTNTPTYRELPNWLRQAVDEELQRERFAAAQIDQDEIRRLMRRSGVVRMELAEKADDGAITAKAERSEVVTTLIPSIGMFLLFMMIMTSAPTLLNSTLEEKINKISEFLVSAVSPFELMMGKLVGALLTAVTLSLTYLLALAYIAHRYDVLDLIPVSLFFWFFVFLILAMVTFGAFCLAIGAACSEIRDAQSLMVPLMIIMMIPVLLWQPVMQNPSGGFATAASLFPPATPMLMFLRMAVPPGVPWWEVALGVSGCLLFMLFAVWSAARVYRVGILSQGQAPSLAKLVKWVFSK